MARGGIALAAMVLAAGCGGDDGETVRYEDHSGREVEVDCTGDEPVIRDASTDEPVLDYFQDAVEACQE